MQVLAAALHADECLRGVGPDRYWSPLGHTAHERKSLRSLTRCAETGKHLTTKEG